jgi:4-carboxymuconolactone decarboxylase
MSNQNPPHSAIMLAAVRAVAPALANHTEAKIVGGRPDEIPELVTHLAFYAGWPCAWSAMSVVKNVFDKRGE